MSADLIFVDTNVLVSAVFRDAEHHAPARAFLDRAQAGEVELCIAPQILAEFYAVATDPRRVTSPMTADEALEAIEKFLVMPGMTLLPVPVDVVTRWMALVRERPVTRGKVFDLQIVAVLQGNAVRRIATFNRQDFDKVEGVELVELGAA